MDAKLLLNERHALSEISFAELVVWHLATPVSGSGHSFKYRLAFVVDGICVIRYDNEAGKGDHTHKSDEETPYEFITPQLLLNDFWNDVDNWRSAHE
jgi:hypothetical protein